MAAAGIKRSSRVTKIGRSVQPLGRGVAARLTATGLPSGKEGDQTDTIVSLVAIISGLLELTLSGDVIYLAMTRAKVQALASGVSEVEFTRICKELTMCWDRKRKGNPLAQMF